MSTVSSGRNKMNTLLVVLLVISLIGNAVGVYVVYKYMNLRTWFAEAQAKLSDCGDANRGLTASVNDLTAELDQHVDTRMVYLHHSVGRRILSQGGLRNDLLDMGILVKSATYGDEIGEDTDICHWAGKFDSSMSDILEFRSHGNLYHSDGTTNDIVVFKPCYPNSDIVGEGTMPGDPYGEERTMANYKATFEHIKPLMAEHPNKLFIYMTAPPRVPEATTVEMAARAKEFNDWLINEFQPNYATETGQNNFYVFDLFGTLANEKGFLRADYRLNLPGDSHPNEAGAKAAASAFLAMFQPLWNDWKPKLAKS
ncbi:hypothetical protein GF420_01615 [candidate division GN15 bacterium]|nr:hypothetical protein [candidate division GN15 bacterium]